MTDLEITRLCAEVIGLEILEDFSSWNPPVQGIDVQRADKMPFRYDPLHDDAQAMALVQRLRLWCCPTGENDWTVYDSIPGEANVFVTTSSLNRAICECVAKMRATKVIDANLNGELHAYSSMSSLRNTLQ